MQPPHIKEKAIQYRKQGYSYGMILEKLDSTPAKSTLSDWLKNIPYKPNKEVTKRIALGQQKSGKSKHDEMINDIHEMKKLAKRGLGCLTKRDLWLLGIGVYLGEGAKINEHIRISNSDPKIINIAIKWFKEICELSNKNFAPCLHLYPDNDVKKTLSFWSKTTGIPKKQFMKTYIDTRTNKSGKRNKKLPYGTLHLRIKSCGKKEHGRSLHRLIMGWIESSIEQINARK